VREEDIVYFRAIRHVPADIREKLPGEYHEALDTPVRIKRLAYWALSSYILLGQSHP